jgi:hypothetical protein
VDEHDGWASAEFVLLDLGLLALDRAAACRQTIETEGLMGADEPHPLLTVQMREQRFAAEMFKRLRVVGR